MLFIQTKSRYALYLLLCILFAGACSKKKIEEKAYEPSTLNKVFEDYILNKDITVTQASLDGRDTTPMFSGYVFKLLKNTYYDGPFEARHNGQTYTGTWQSNDDYSKLILNIQGTGALQWVSISWKFKSKSANSLELIPWFDTDGGRYVKFAK